MKKHAQHKILCETKLQPISIFASTIHKQTWAAMVERYDPGVNWHSRFVMVIDFDVCVFDETLDLDVPL